MTLGAADVPGGRARTRTGIAPCEPDRPVQPRLVLRECWMSHLAFCLIPAGRTSFRCPVFHRSPSSSGTTLCRARLTAFLLWSFLQPFADERLPREVRQEEEKNEMRAARSLQEPQNTFRLLNHISWPRTGPWVEKFLLVLATFLVKQSSAQWFRG